MAFWSLRQSQHWGGGQNEVFATIPANVLKNELKEMNSGRKKTYFQHAIKGINNQVHHARIINRIGDESADKSETQRQLQCVSAIIIIISACATTHKKEQMRVHIEPNRESACYKRDGMPPPTTIVSPVI